MHFGRASVGPNLFFGHEGAAMLISAQSILGLFSGYTLCCNYQYVASSWNRPMATVAELSKYSKWKI